MSKIDIADSEECVGSPLAITAQMACLEKNKYEFLLKQVDSYDLVGTSVPTCSGIDTVEQRRHTEEK